MDRKELREKALTASISMLDLPKMEKIYGNNEYTEKLKECLSLYIELCAELVDFVPGGQKR